MARSAPVTLAQIERAMADLEQKREKLARKTTQEVRARIEALLKRAGLELRDVFPASSKKEAGRRLKAPRAPKARRLPPKYRNPKDSRQTWSGRGRRPAWFIEAQKKNQVKSLLIR